ncbi:MAG: 50S ribosomal protein L21 [Candidatus Absconditabacterales bacterium]
MYAVIDLGGHQYIVKKGDSITVDKIDLVDGAKLNIDNVLAIFDSKGEKVSIGTPFVKKAKVICNVTKSQKGEKVKILKFKRKNRYQRNIGFRAKQTVLEIKDIQFDE